MQKDKYFELFCKYDGCNFCVRYSYQEIESGVQTCDEISEQNSVFNFNNYIQKEQIKYSIKHLRTLNFNHSDKAHKLARVKPIHSICDSWMKISYSISFFCMSADLLKSFRISIIGFLN